jgi:hypothetical protein
VLVLVPPCVIVTLPGDVERMKPGLSPFAGQLFTKLFAFSVPMFVVRFQPVDVPNVGLKRGGEHALRTRA